MTLLLLNALVWHILLGITSLVSYTGLSLLLRERILNVKWLKIYSFVGFLGFLLSWISGGYYYTTYYGKAVKPIIVATSTPWIHTILMETKEHIFLFLPFLSFVALIIVNLFPKEIESNGKLKQSLILLRFLIVTLGMIITLAGISISGSVTKKF